MENTRKLQIKTITSDKESKVKERKTKGRKKWLWSLSGVVMANDDQDDAIYV